jgi:hypothetical protein
VAAVFVLLFREVAVTSEAALPAEAQQAKADAANDRGRAAA